MSAYKILYIVICVDHLYYCDRYKSFKKKGATIKKKNLKKIAFVPTVF
jgi:hypothetical protein